MFSSFADGLVILKNLSLSYSMYSVFLSSSVLYAVSFNIDSLFSFIRSLVIFSSCLLTILFECNFSIISFFSSLLLDLLIKVLIKVFLLLSLLLKIPTIRFTSFLILD